MKKVLLYDSSREHPALAVLRIMRFKKIDVWMYCYTGVHAVGTQTQ